MTSQFPDLPAGVDPNAGHVVFVMTECRTCNDRGPLSGPQERAVDTSLWFEGHSAETGHDRFYLWSLTRNTGRAVTFGQNRKTR